MSDKKGFQLLDDSKIYPAEAKPTSPPPTYRPPSGGMSSPPPVYGALPPNGTKIPLPPSYDAPPLEHKTRPITPVRTNTWERTPSELSFNNEMYDQSSSRTRLTDIGEPKYTRSIRGSVKKPNRKPWIMAGVAALVVVVVVAVVVGVVLAARKAINDAEEESTTEVVVEFDVEIHMEDLTWNNNLANSSSDEYNELANNVSITMDESLSGTDGYEGIEVNSFSNGSVICDFTVKTSGQTASDTTEDQMNTKVTKGLETNTRLGKTTSKVKAKKTVVREKLITISLVMHLSAETYVNAYKDSTSDVFKRKAKNLQTKMDNHFKSSSLKSSFSSTIVTKFRDLGDQGMDITVNLKFKVTKTPSRSAIIKAFSSANKELSGEMCISKGGKYDGISDCTEVTTTKATKATPTQAVKKSEYTGKTGAYSQAPSVQPGASSQAPSGQTGASSQAPSGQPGASSQAPSGQTGASSQAPSGQPGASSQAPSGQSGASSQAPTGQPGASSQVPSGQTGAYSQAPSGQPGASSQAPSGQTGGYSQAPSGQPGASSQAPSGQTGGYSQAPSGQPGASSQAPTGQPGASSQVPSGQTGGYSTLPSGQTGAYSSSASLQPGASTPSGGRYYTMHMQFSEKVWENAFGNTTGQKAENIMKRINDNLKAHNLTEDTCGFQYLSNCSGKVFVGLDCKSASNGWSETKAYDACKATPKTDYGAMGHAQCYVKVQLGATSQPSTGQSWTTSQQPSGQTGATSQHASGASVSTTSGYSGTTSGDASCSSGGAGAGVCSANFPLTCIKDKSGATSPPPSGQPGASSQKPTGQTWAYSTAASTEGRYFSMFMQFSEKAWENAFGNKTGQKAENIMKRINDNLKAHNLTEDSCGIQHLSNCSGKVFVSLHCKGSNKNWTETNVYDACKATPKTDYGAMGHAQCYVKGYGGDEKQTMWTSTPSMLQGSSSLAPSGQPGATSQAATGQSWATSQQPSGQTGAISQQPSGASVSPTSGYSGTTMFGDASCSSGGAGAGICSANFPLTCLNDKWSATSPPPSGQPEASSHKPSGQTGAYSTPASKDGHHFYAFIQFSEKNWESAFGNITGDKAGNILKRINENVKSKGLSADEKSCTMKYSSACEGKVFAFLICISKDKEWSEQDVYDACKEDPNTDYGTMGQAQCYVKGYGGSAHTWMTTSPSFGQSGSSGHPEVTSLPPSGQPGATSLPPSGQPGATSLPPSGQPVATSLPPSGQTGVTSLPSSGLPGATSLPPSGQTGVTSLPSSGLPGATSLPPSGQTGVTSLPSSGLSGATSLPPSGQTGVTSLPSSGQPGATSLPPSGQTGVTSLPSSGQPGATSLPPSGQPGATSLPPSGQTGATSPPASGASVSPSSGYFGTTVFGDASCSSGGAGAGICSANFPLTCLNDEMWGATSLSPSGQPMASSQPPSGQPVASSQPPSGQPVASSQPPSGQPVVSSQLPSGQPVVSSQLPSGQPVVSSQLPSGQPETSSQQPSGQPVTSTPTP